MMDRRRGGVAGSGEGGRGRCFGPAAGRRQWWQWPVSLAGLVLLLVLLLGVRATDAHEHHGHEHEHVHHAQHYHHHQEEQAAAAVSPTGGWLDSAWGRAFASTTLISVAPTLILPFIPLASKGADGAVAINEALHRTLLAFAAGGLLGEVFLHSLPHLLEGAQQEEEEEGAGHEHGHHHDGHGHGHGAAGRVSLWVLAGFLVFFASEKLVKVVLGEEGHSHSHSQGHSHSHAHSKRTKADDLDEDEEGEGEGESSDDGSWMDGASGLRRRSRRIRERDGRRKSPPGGAGSSPRKSGKNGSRGRKQEEALVRGGGGKGKLKASGYLNITVDLLHNLTDGIAIGASFAGGNKGSGVGLATTLSVLMHEVPHEIGDFAILVQSGMSLRGAFLMQFCTAVAAYVGTLAGLASTRHEGLERVLVGLMSGGFLYVGAVSVLPELLAGKAGGWQALREVAGVVCGIGLMMLVGHGEEGH